MEQTNRNEQENLNALEERLGYHFSDIRILKTALTHSSYANEVKKRGIPVRCNERLEFLGDAVLSLITSSYIFSLYPEDSEGDLSKLRSLAVRDIALSEYAMELGMGDCLYLGKGEDNPVGRSRKSTLENAFEAVTGAIYLDGGLAAAEKVVLPFIKKKVAESQQRGETRDYKTILQEIVQMDKGERLEYIPVAEYGPDHSKTFEVEVHLNSNVIGKGTGKSKRMAEQAAARMALSYFGLEDKS